MPRDVIHRALADDISDRLPEPLDEDVERFRPLYALGSILPDIFYYDTLPRVRCIESDWTDTADRLHHNPADAYAVPFRIHDAVNDHPGAARAIGAGIIAHHCVDAIFHPYIHAQSGLGSRAAQTRHQLLETAISQILLNHRGESYHQWGISGLPTPQALLNATITAPLLSGVGHDTGMARTQDFIELYRMAQRVQSLNRSYPIAVFLQLIDPLLPEAARMASSLFFPPMTVPFVDATTPLRLLHGATGSIETISLNGLADRARDYAAEVISHFAQAIRAPTSSTHFRQHAPLRSPRTGVMEHDQPLRHVDTLPIEHWWDVPQALRRRTA